jgi:hypothetical protein
MSAMRGTGAAWATIAATLNARGIKSRVANGMPNNVRRIVPLRLRRATMVSEIRYHSKKMRRKGNGGTTTRYIAVEEKSRGFSVNIYEFRPTNVKDGDSVGYSYQAVSREWFSKVKGAIDVAGIAFQNSLNSGLTVVVANTSDRN